MGKVDKRISIVINMSEDRLRKLIREEVEATVAKLSEETLREAYGIRVQFGRPSLASLIPTEAFPELKAEDIRARIKELEQEVASGGEYGLHKG